MIKTITVKGNGHACVKPDLIVLSVRLVTEDKDYEKTTEIAGEKINALNESFERAGLEKQAVKTTGFNVSTRYESVKGKDGAYKSVFKGYVCNHNLKTEFDFDMKKLAKALSAISECLAKPEFSVSFTVKDKDAVNAELLKSATKNAREKAEVICSASGVKLGDLVSVEYGFGDKNAYSDTDFTVESRCMARAEACLSDIAIEPDDVKVDDTVKFVWEIL